MPFFSIDSYYLLLVLPALLLSVLAQAFVSSSFRRFEKVPNRRGLTGAAAARAILDANGLSDVQVARTAGRLSDHYDPRSRILALSDATIASTSVAAVGVAAHEASHAIQHAEGYLPNRIRSALVPVANLGSLAGPYLAIFGIVLGWGVLVNLGIALYLAAVAFYLVTLPVEFDASARAVRILEADGMLAGEELAGARTVLRAAALTYVASALVALASLLRLVLLSRSRKR